jgi:hypothetical protein
MKCTLCGSSNIELPKETIKGLTRPVIGYCPSCLPKLRIGINVNMSFIYEILYPQQKRNCLWKKLI